MVLVCSECDEEMEILDREGNKVFVDHQCSEAQSAGSAKPDISSLSDKDVSKEAKKRNLIRTISEFKDSELVDEFLERELIDYIEDGILEKQLEKRDIGGSLDISELSDEEIEEEFTGRFEKETVTVTGYKLDEESEQTDSNESEEEIWTCENCGKEFDTELGMYGHQATCKN